MTNESFLELAYTLVRIRDLDVLLETILKRLRGMLGADAGSIFIYDEDTNELIFKYTQNDSVYLPFKEFSIAADETSIAGYVAKTREILRLKDVYHLEDEYPFHFNVSFDKMSGYRTKSMIVYPITDLNDQLTGVLQFINKKRYEVPLTLENVGRIVLPFNENDEKIAGSLTGIVSLALENGLLYDNIERMLEGFIKATSTAIDNRNSCTAGHTARVFSITSLLAQEMHKDLDEFPDFFMNRLKEKILRYACYLHDFGKLSVRESVLNRMEKLSSEQFSAVKTRLSLAKACLMLNKDERYEEINALEEAVIKANKPGKLSESIKQAIDYCSNFYFADADGNELPLLTPYEYECLCVEEGVHTEGELDMIKGHVKNGFDILNKIPWTKELRDVPVVACSHHERMDGNGYPFGREGGEIHIFSRVMGVADAYDFLTNDTIPYREAMMPEDAVEVMRSNAAEGGLDPKIVDFFIEKEIYKRV
ncbi:GAF and HD-GYP domain-containing protein [Limisalsivibrio acetivorans]|uniref:GAF and HD-GYP domain-containing protein n=1 Tax=Limisalsivibrio acetivorans TaxID=1304888 RepID=UPI0003B3867E|nr:HD family phosphohydrolase [Limisalsivibrio acetivorans]